MSTTRRNFIKTAVAGTAGATTALAAQGRRKQNAAGFRSTLPTNVERVFVAPEFWANRLQDWRLKNIIRFNKAARAIKLECWPRYADPQSGKQYPGWPITIQQTDNYGRKAAAYLPTLQIAGMKDAVAQIVEEATGEVVYTLRINGNAFRPKVFAPSKYTINVGELGTPRHKSLRGVEAVAESNNATLKIEL